MKSLVPEGQMKSAIKYAEAQAESAEDPAEILRWLAVAEAWEARVDARHADSTCRPVARIDALEIFAHNVRQFCRTYESSESKLCDVVEDALEVLDRQ